MTLMSAASPDLGSPLPETRSQYAALCWRLDAGRVQVLLITSRDTGRWVIPKGWQVEGLSPAQSAAREAFEEAGVRGAVSDASLGHYHYDKALCRRPGREDHVACVVTVYPLQVADLASRFPERGQRKRKWFAPEKAARRVAEPELRALLAGFVPPPAGIAAPAS
ncbi:MAG: NUDIX hydrolase [Cereibacter changlensis]